MSKTTKSKQSVIVPLSERVLFRKDEAKKETAGGIVLPDGAEQETLTGRIVAISPDLDDKFEFPVKQYDKVLVNPRNAIPVELTDKNLLYVIPHKDVIAVFRSDESES